MRVLITGGTGFIGRVIVKELLKAGHEVSVLTRNVQQAALAIGSSCQYYQWPTPDTTLPPLNAFDGVDGVINLMGEGIADKKWTDEQKKKIYNSRVEGTHKLIEAIESLEKKPKVLVSTSAIGIYGPRGSEDVTEQTEPGSDFLSDLCKDWERTALRAEDAGLRVAIVRTGVVLGRHGGALKKMLPIFKLGLGGRIGTGEQFMSWIHVEDLARIYVEAVSNSSFEGIYNGTAPYPVTNQQFTTELGRALKRPVVFPVPAVALRGIFGEMSTVLLDGQKVLPTRVKQTSFRYQYPTIEMALKETAY